MYEVIERRATHNFNSETIPPDKTLNGFPYMIDTFFVPICLFLVFPSNAWDFVVFEITKFDKITKFTGMLYVRIIKQSL